MRVLQIFFICLFLISCGSSHHYAPIQPLTNSNVEGRISVSYSLSNFHSVVMQMGFYFKVSEQDMVGFSLQNFILPNSLSYVRFWERGSDAGNYQFHVNNLFTFNYSPTYEIRYALFNHQNDANQSFELGLGVYTTPLLVTISGQRIPFSISPIVGYQYRDKTIMAQAQYIYNYSRYKTKEILMYQHNNFDYQNSTWHKSGPKLVYDNNEITAFYKVPDLYSKWVIKTSDSDSLVLAGRDPYPDCYACGKQKSDLSATIPDSTYKVYWLSGQHGGQYIILRNLQEVYSDYKEGKTVNLRTGKNYVNRSLRNNTLLDDISISIGTLLPEE